ncbi:MAG: hypothetical protein ACOVPA_21660 [Rubrivivax sp.]
MRHTTTRSHTGGQGRLSGIQQGNCPGNRPGITRMRAWAGAQTVSAGV